MRKEQKDLVKGDIIKFIYGDFDNVVMGEVIEVKDNGKPYGCEVKFRYLSNNRIDVMYGSGWSLINVVEGE